MSLFSVSELQALMRQRGNIRNLSVIAHVDHGKTTLTDSLVGAAGLIPKSAIGKALATDGLKEEVSRGITIKSTGISMHFTLPDDLPFAPKDAEGPEFLINLIDSPGHVDFSSEVTAALRVTDGALVVVDCVEGVCVQTETVLRQALLERIKPVLCINKVDRFFLSLRFSPEDMYQKFCAIIEHVNEIIERYTTDETRAVMGDLRVSAADGSVTFAAGKMGWAFSVPMMARFYAKVLGKPVEAIMGRMWGERFYNPATRKWSSNAFNEQGEQNVRGFCKYCLGPLQKVVDACEAMPEGFNAPSEEAVERLERTLRSIGVELSHDQRGQLESSSALMRAVLQSWMPAHVPLLESVACHLPSPHRAQAYRAELLYTGPLEDDVARSIRECDPSGPLVVFISKLVPPSEGFEKSSRFFAFGRVFSGTLRSGTKVNIMGANYEVGSTSDYWTNKGLQNVSIMMGKKAMGVDEVCAGNTVALGGVDQYLLKSGTLTSSGVTHPIRNMKFSVSPVVQCAVKVVNGKDLPKLTAGLRRLSKFDSIVQCITSETGEHIVCAAGELHLEICIGNLRDIVGESVEIVTSEPIVTYCETVTASVEEPVFGKSTNKHNRIMVTAEPFGDELVEAVLSGKLSMRGDLDQRADLLAAAGWSRQEARTRLWAFGPEGSTKAANAIVDSTVGVQHLNEVKDSMCAAFHWATREGALCGEEVRGCRFSLVDARFHADGAHRGGGQVMPMTRSVLHHVQLKSRPRLMQPIFAVDVQCPTEVIPAVYSCVARRKGQVNSTELHPLTDTLSTLSGFVPVAKSFNLHSELMQATGGQAFPVLQFSHWEVIDEDPFDPTTEASQIIARIRERKGMPALSMPEEKGR